MIAGLACFSVNTFSTRSTFCAPRGVMFTRGQPRAAKRVAGDPGDTDVQPMRSQSASPTVSRELVPYEVLSSSSSSLSHSTGQLRLVTQSTRELLNESRQMSDRWSGNVTHLRNASKLRGINSGLAASEALLQHQREVQSDHLYIGLTGLKRWVRLHIHRVIVPPENVEDRQVVANLAVHPLCITMSGESCGVRSYLESVCHELRIDFYRVGGSWWEEGMIENVLAEALAQPRSLVLLDRPAWFSYEEYGTRGIAFVHHLRAMMERARTQKIEQMMMDNHNAILTNPFQRESMSELLPNLWIVLSSTGTNVHHEVINLASGEVLRMDSPSKDAAAEIVQICVKKKMGKYKLFPDKEIDELITQTDYVRQIDAISSLLHDKEVGAIVAIMEHACEIAGNQYVMIPPTSRHPRNLLPTDVAVRQALNQLSGHSVGGYAVAMAPQQHQSQAARAAQLLNSMEH